MRRSNHVVLSPTLTHAIATLMAVAALTAACSDPANDSADDYIEIEDNVAAPEYKIENVNVIIDDLRCSESESKPDVKLRVDFQDRKNEFTSVVDFESETTQDTCWTAFQLPQPTNLNDFQVLVVEVYDGATMVARCPFYTRDLDRVVGSSGAVLAVTCEDRGAEIEVGYRID